LYRILSDGGCKKLSFSKLFQKYGEFADYTNVCDFSMRESAFSIDSLIDESYKAGSLLMDEKHLLEVVGD